ncbi:Os06g0128800, partial [Oryza sativa Japonica Group]
AAVVLFADPEAAAAVRDGVVGGVGVQHGRGGGGERRALVERHARRPRGRGVPREPRRRRRARGGVLGAGVPARRRRHAAGVVQDPRRRRARRPPPAARAPPAQLLPPLPAHRRPRPRRRAPRRPRPRRPRPAASAAACPVDAAGAARVVPRGDGHPGVGDIRRRGGDAGVGGVGRRGGGVAVIDRDAARQRERLPVEKRWKNSSPGRTYFYLFFVLIETLTNPVMGWSNVSSARRVVLRVYVYTYVHARKLPLAAIRMYIQPTYV